MKITDWHITKTKEKHIYKIWHCR